MPIDESGFRSALSHFASGVTIVTTRHDDQRYGMTVASFASLSLRPPLVLVCIEKTVKTHDAIAASGAFAVNILAEDQVGISNRFASRIEDKFADLESHDGTEGLPLIDGALTTLECRVTEQLPGGDHTIFVGEVLDAVTNEGEPLLYFRSGYRAVVK
jgi:flavin reductase (DIM6/NTAB) family NADH-FMN oxidoreductase RutF